MIITKDDNGKLDINLIDTEILVHIDREIAGLNFIESLFNWDVVSSVRNGYWRFDKPSPAPLQGSDVACGGR